MYICIKVQRKQFIVYTNMIKCYKLDAKLAYVES